MSTPMRRFINATLRERVVPLGARRVLNAGATRGAHDREGMPYRDYFPGSEYLTLDKRPGADWPMDLCRDPFMLMECDLVDLVICMSVLEHVERPRIAVSNMRECLRPGGHLFLAVPFLYPYHPGHDFGDFWRFTADGLRLLFAGMTEVFLEAAPNAAGFCALFKEPT